LSVAPFVDGVILVSEANKTRRGQILQAERAIETAQGKLLGHVLNKRTYPVPEWIYRRL
jgi:Mrp family chromosome partitioning ATPase